MSDFINILLFSTVFFYSSFGQVTTIYTDKDETYKDAIDHFENKNFDLSDELFTTYQEDMKSTFVKNLFCSDAELRPVVMAYNMDAEDADDKFDVFAHYNSTSILLNDAKLARGNHYFISQDYTEAIAAYETIDRDGLEYYTEDEVKFKLAYSYFAKGQFDKANDLFRDLSLTNRKYYFPSNYYYGICRFLNNDFDMAIKCFDIVQDCQDYKNYIPYYLVQLHFTQGDYPKVIAVGEDKLKMENIENVNNIHQLVGQSYFMTKDYANALKHLEIYEKNTPKLTPSDFYQLGYIYHELKDYKNSIKNFSELINLDSQMGQYSNYYNADNYIHLGNKESARNSFENAGSSNFNKMIKEESILNYGKLSVELGYDREAINTLMSMDINSVYYNEAQSILKNLFVNTHDYATAQKTLEELNTVTPQLYEAYQIVSFNKGLQEMNDGKPDAAEQDLLKAEKINRDIATSIRTEFWLGELNHRKADYKNSNKYLDKYFVLDQGIEVRDRDVSPAMAYYTRAYNYLKQKNYTTASISFQNSLKSMDNYNPEKKETKTRLINDIYLRLGDAYLANKDLKEALQNYELAIKNKSENIDYAMFQKAMIYGLNNKPEDKIDILTDLINTYRNSPYRPGAISEIAGTFRDLSQYDKATVLYNTILTEYANNTHFANNARMQLGLINYNKGNIDEAIKNYKSILNNNPEAELKKEALTSIQEIYINDLKNPGDYVEYLKSVPGVEVEKINLDSISFLSARKSYQLDSTEVAIGNINKYLEKFPNGLYALEALYYRGNLLLDKKSYPASLADFKSILNKGFNNYYELALYKAAFINFNIVKDYSIAQTQYKELSSIVQDENKKYESLLGVVRSSFMLNDFDNVNTFGNVILANSLTTDKEKSAAHYYIAKVAESNKKYDVALQHLNKVISENPNSNLAAECRYLIAKVYFERNEVEIAKKLTNEANIQNTAYPYWVAKGLLLTADIAVHNSDFLNAKAALEAINENFADDKSILDEVKTKMDNVDKLMAEKSRLESKSKNGNINMDNLK